MADVRERVRIRRILDRLEVASPWPQEWEDDGNALEYAYRQRAVLVRSRDRQRVAEALPKILQRLAVDAGHQQLGSVDQPPAGHVSKQEMPPSTGDPEQDEAALWERATGDGPAVGGVVPLSWGPVPGWDDALVVPRVLDAIDDLLGAGLAWPDHVIWLSPCYPCPASEPLEVASGTSTPTHAYPSPGRGFCSVSSGGTGKGVKVAIVDTGLYQQATTLSWMGGVHGGADAEATATPIGYAGGHGTFAAGCVRAVAPEARVFVGSAFPYVGADFESEVGTAIHQILRKGMPDILVMPFAPPSRKSAGLVVFDDLYENHLRFQKGLALLASAGNEGTSDLRWPAAYPWVTSVGALNANCDALADFSNHGSWVDVSAPGEDLVNAFVTGEYQCVDPENNGAIRHFEGMARWSGTSFSLPIVAGMVAALASATGLSAAAALQQLLDDSRRASIPGVGPVLVPGYRPCGCGSCGCSDGGCC